MTETNPSAPVTPEALAEDWWRSKPQQGDSRWITMQRKELSVLAGTAYDAGRVAALQEATAIVTRVCRDDLEDYYGQIRVEVGAALQERIKEYRGATS